MGMFVVGNDKTKGTPAVVTTVERQEPYALLSRVKDDSNNEIGTVVGYHTDANNQKYAVVCLDARYRLASGYVLSVGVEITGLSKYNGAAMFYSTDTATSNCTKILDFATANNYTSTAITHCRSKSFIINGETYYGQLPNIMELLYVYGNALSVNSKDTSGSEYSSLMLISASTVFSSTQYGSSGNVDVIRGDVGGVRQGSITNNYFVVPILEIPIN